MDEDHEKALKKKLTELLSQATEGDREQARALLRARAITFGWTMMAIAAILLGVVASFETDHPAGQGLLLLMAVIIIVCAIWRIDRTNSDRRKLAHKMMRGKEQEED